LGMFIGIGAVPMIQCGLVRLLGIHSQFPLNRSGATMPSCRRRVGSVGGSSRPRVRKSVDGPTGTAAAVDLP
jgi:hypothetical protein